MQVFVKTFDCKTLALQLDETDFVSRVKSILLERAGIPLNHQRLFFAGKVLEDERQLIEYKIAKEDTLHLVLAMPGGRDDYDDEIHSSSQLQEEIFSTHQVDATRRMSEIDFLEIIQGILSPRPVESNEATWNTWADDGLELSRAESTSCPVAPPYLNPSSPNAARNEFCEHRRVSAQWNTLQGNVDDPKPPSAAESLSSAESGSEDALQPQTNSIETLPLPPVMVGQKGLSFDVTKVDDRMRRRLLKNRLSAERSRLRKLAEKEEERERLRAVEAENEALRAHVAALQRRLAEAGEWLTTLTARAGR